MLVMRLLCARGEYHGQRKCNRTTQNLPNDAHLLDDGLTISERQPEQRVHYGTSRGRPPLVALPTHLHYFVVTLHNPLRTVPTIFLDTIHANVTKEKMKLVAQFCYDEHGIKIVNGGDIALHTEKGTKKLSMSAKSWHGSMCMALLDSELRGNSEVCDASSRCWGEGRNTLLSCDGVVGRLIFSKTSRHVA
jgi:hypothetical protein